MLKERFGWDGPDDGKRGYVRVYNNDCWIVHNFHLIEICFGVFPVTHNKNSQYDYLPLVIQADPRGTPELFEVPLECAIPVHIHHPRHPELSDLGLQWCVSFR